MSSKSKARRERKIAAEVARTETALSTACPACKSRPGVWCGPTDDRASLYGPAEPWMHHRRYPKAADQ